MQGHWKCEMDQVRETLDDRGQKLLTTWCSVDGDLKPCVVELVARLHERNSHGPMFEPDASLLDLRHPKSRSAQFDLIFMLQKLVMISFKESSQGQHEASSTTSKLVAGLSSEWEASLA